MSQSESGKPSFLNYSEAYVPINKWLKTISYWFHAKSQSEENGIKVIQRLWSDQEAGQNISFMCVAVNTSTASASEVEDLGVSIWSKQILANTLSYGWHIQEKVEKGDVVYFGKSDSFDLGSTQAIRACDIATVLDDWSLSLSRECDELCIVVYGKQTMSILENYWKSPVPMVLLDLEEAWGLNDTGLQYPTFKELALATKGVGDVTSNLDDAGNRAYCLLLLLQKLRQARAD